MKKVIASSDYKNDHAANILFSHLNDQSHNLGLDNACFYYHFPILKNTDDIMAEAQILLLSPSHGILLVYCDSSKSQSTQYINSIEENVASIYSLILSKLLKNPKLCKWGQPIVSMKALLFFPSTEKRTELYVSSNSSIAFTLFDIDEFLKQNFSCIPSNIFSELIATIEGTKGMIQIRKRNVTPEDSSSMAFHLNNLEQEIAVLDTKQKDAALSQLDGPQRIRGLAGSGKTVILSLKAAWYHIKYPNRKILYTFYTKSLYDYIKSLITKFYRQQEDKDPNWENLNIFHAWGGQSQSGVYFNTCMNNGIIPLTYKDIAGKKGNDNAFDLVCKSLLDQTNGNLKKEYDYILIDEGQDFPPSFYQLCRQITQNDCIIWALDQLQSIFDVELQSTIKLFENQNLGFTGIDLEELQKKYSYNSNDIVLYKCYRNPREILVVAHAIGFGIYGKHIVQMINEVDYWSDLGYKVISGTCQLGEEMIIERPEENSPLSISKYYDINQIIETHKGEDVNSEVLWVSKQIIRNIKNEKLRPEDIMVICIDDRNAKRYCMQICDVLYNNGISCHNLFDDNFSIEFAIEGSVTLTSVYRAKGNEAAMVYVIGTDIFKYNADDISFRNKLFTAFTRSKAWVRITGCGDDALYLFREIEKAKSNFPHMRYKFPNIEDIKVFQRDMSKLSARKAKIHQELLRLAESLDVDVNDLLESMKKSDKKNGK